jgi:C1A family cysteine protease
MSIKEILLAALAITSTLVAVNLFKDSLVSANSNETEHLEAFHAYNRRHGKAHGSHQEFAYRFAIYMHNRRVIEEHNKKNKSYTLGENKFADLTFEEFSSKYLSQVVISNEVSTQNLLGSNADVTSIDWREKNVVTRVKNQASCGSCWAFCATGSFESGFAIATGELVEFSEKELMDCSVKYGNHGCQGGLPGFAYQYIKENKLGLESDYPYRPINGKCQIDKSKRRVGLSDFKYLDTPDVTGLKKAIAITPVSVGIEVQYDFQMYTGGIYTSDDSSCGKQLNHGVLAVGFNDEDETPYFIVKNSWGPDWGEKGYIRIASGSGSGTCGIANKYDVYPVFSK